MRSRVALVLLSALALLFAGAASASACTTDDWLRLGSGESTPGTTVMVEGGGFDAGVVDLRWTGMEGASLGQATVGADGRFTATVEVPAAAGGVYPVVAVQDSGQGLRGWAYADLVVPAPTPPQAPSSAPVAPLAAAALLLVAVAGVGVAVHRRRRRARSAALERELETILEQDEASTGLR